MTQSTRGSLLRAVLAWVLLTALLTLAACSAGGESTARLVEEAPPDDRMVDVLLLTNPVARQVEFVDPATLETLGIVRFRENVHRAGLTADGRYLLAHLHYEPHPGAGTACCELRSFDLRELVLSPQIEAPSTGHALSGNGRYVLTQQGNTGIEVIDAQSLEHAFTVAADTSYVLEPGPSWRWAIAERPVDEELRFLDLMRRELGPALARPAGRGGVWLGDRYAMYGYDEDGQALWLLDAEAGSLEDARRIPLDLPPEQAHEFATTRVVASGGQLVIYNSIAWDTKALGRKDVGTAVPGGFFVVDPGDGTARHLQPDLDLKYLLPGSAGDTLYGLAMAVSSDEVPRLLAFDQASGAVEVERELGHASWSLSVGRAPPDLVPTARVEAQLPPPAAWSAPRLDIDPGVLIIDYGPREGWDPGRPGAARGALVPLHPETGEELRGYRPINTGQGSEVVPSPDGRLLALLRHETQSSGERVHLVDRRSWAVLGTFEDVPARIWTLAWTPDSETLYGFRALSTSIPREGFEVWALDVRELTGEVIATLDFEVREMLLAPDGRTLYFLAFRATQCCGIDVQGDPFIAALDIESGQVQQVPLPGVLLGQGHFGLFEGTEEMNVLLRPDAAIAPDGSRLFVAHAHDDRVTVVDLERLEVETTFQPQRLESALSRLGSWLLGQFASQAEAKGGAYFTKQATVSPDGRWLYITGTRDEPCAGERYFPCVSGLPVGLQVVDAKTLDLVAEFEDIGRIEVSPDGRWVVGHALAYDYRDEDAEWADEVGFGLTVIDTETLEVVGHVEDAAYVSIAISPDSRFVYATSRRPGYEASLRNEGRCEEACELITVLRLPDAQILATRELVGWLSLVGLGAP